MTSKWIGQVCPVCAEGVLHDNTKTITQSYKGHTYSSQTHGAFCNQCAEGFVEFDAAEESAWIDFRNRIDALEAAELWRIRKKLKLTQMEAAQLAGGGKNAFSRYERGQAKPVAAVVNLFRLLDLHPELLSDLKISRPTGS